MNSDAAAERLSPAQASEFLRGAGFGAGPYRIQPLAGGYWNTVLKVEVPGRTLVLKHFVAVLPDSLFPNLPQAEAAALERLRGLDVAPEPLGFWPDANILVYNYIEGAPWQQGTAALAQLLRRKERASAGGFRVVPWQPADILVQGDGFFARCQSDSLVQRFLSHRPLASPMSTPPRLSLLHTDIGAANLVGEGADLRLIDWQCPAQGDLTEDVYTCLSPAFQILNEKPPLSAAQIEHFFDALALPHMPARYQQLRPALAYRMAGYCCVRYQSASTPVLRQRYTAAAQAEFVHMGQA